MSHQTDANAPRITIEAFGPRVRATFNGATVADSTRALVLRERGYPPRIYFPPGDVDMGLLRPTRHTTHCPHKGDAAYWTLRVGDREVENAAWSYPHPIDDVAAIAGHLSFVDAVAVDPVPA
ncbi:MAG: DUF427 domain-containing protein [Alphaproteobacteria bacterium]|nr:MAG: DUF427 domain-containing protein [Alphaproteobacteria bacterium]